jgi:uncharacterized protein (TIGR02001 family)
MRTLKIALAATVASLAMVGAASAQDSSPKFAFNIGANNDYVFRGISQTDEDLSLFGGVDASFMEIGYAGAWLSNVDFGNGTNFEYDLYAGVKPVVGAVTFDLGVIFYGYSGSPNGSNQDYFEGKIAASVPAGPVTLGAALFYSPEFFGKTGDAVYTEINFSTAIPDSKFTVNGALGYQQVQGPLDYATWNVGVGYAFTDNLSLDVRYHDTDGNGFGKIYGGRVVGGLKFTF